MISEWTKAAEQDGFGWTVKGQMEGETTQASFEVLVWSDLVRASMDPPIPVTYWLMLRTAWIYIASGALPALARLRKGPLIAALFPVLFLLTQLTVAVLLGGVVFDLVEDLGEHLLPGSDLLVGGAGAIAGLVTAFAILKAFKAKDSKLFAYYLMHDYAYASGLRGANPPGLEARIEQFADRIGAALASDTEEVLIVGHSSGAQLGVQAIAALLRRGPLPAGSPALSLLSLGQVIPMISFLPEARALRADLRLLAQSEQITWVDVSAPGDGGCFALCNPVAVTGVAPAEGKRWPLVLSVAYSQTLSPAKRKSLNWRFFRLHFQYLCAFDRPGDYDYFRITAGPQTLGARFAGRKPSPSRIETPRAPRKARA